MLIYWLLPKKLITKTNAIQNNLKNDNQYFYSQIKF
jgi:hypothetical protein